MRGSLAQRVDTRLRVETAEISLKGARDTNQDRVATATSGQSALLIACDGMGGHAEGERAAEIAQQLISERFREAAQPLLDPLGFLHLALGQAHQRVVTFGAGTPVEVRPRATCAVCLVQNGSAFWAHVGDSRIYLLRRGKVVARTRDHSHVELLVREGVIRPDQMQNHPMRNFVESCIGGELLLPEMSISPRIALQPGDILLACTDGLWANLDDSELALALAPADVVLDEALSKLATRAVDAGGPTADNTSAVILRYLE